MSGLRMLHILKPPPTARTYDPTSSHTERNVLNVIYHPNFEKCTMDVGYTEPAATHISVVNLIRHYSEKSINRCRYYA